MAPTTVSETGQSEQSPSIDDTIHGRFRAIAASHPDAIAVRQGARELTYAELDRWSDAISASLPEALFTGHAVGVILDRSPALVATLLGVLKAGRAYSIIDPEWPIERVRDIVAQLGASAVVAERDLDLGAPPWSPVQVDREHAEPRPDRAEGADAYAVIFTSGTTGKPRGAVLPHRGVTSMLVDAPFASFGPGAAMLVESALPWDGFTFELWSMLLNGGTALLLDRPPVTGRTVRDAVRGGASVLFLTAALFALLTDEDPDCFAGLTQLMTAGERMSPVHARRFLRRDPSIRLTNLYGPVEGNMLVAGHDVALEDTAAPLGVPIGRILPGTATEILDADGVAVPDGVEGELHIAGPRVALGYLGMPEHPAFAERRIEGVRQHSYATGDLVVRRDGVLSYAGRLDRQVKIRGSRVEPAEIEAVGGSVDGVASIRVVVLERNGRASGLAAFFTAEPDADPAERLRAGFAATLPVFSRPDPVVRVEAMPMTPIGKLDEADLLRRLPVRAEAEQSAPSGGTETAVVDEVASVLGDDRFPLQGASLLQLGLTSLDVARLAMRLERRVGGIVRASDLAAASGLAEVATMLDRRSADRAPAPTLDPTAPVGLNPLQAAFAVNRALDPDDRASLCVDVYRIEGSTPTTAAIAAALQDVQDRHEALRSTYVGAPVPAAIPSAAQEAPRVEVRSVAGSDLAGAEAAAVDTGIAEPLAIESGRVWRAVIGAPEDRSGLVLVVVVHHVAFDGWSESVLADDLGVALAARREGRAPAWAEAPPSLAELASARDRRGRHRSDAAELEAWVDHLRGTAPLVDPEPSTGSEAVRTSSDVGSLTAWTDLAAREGTSLFSTMLAVMAESIRGCFIEADVVVGVPTSSRDSAVEERALTGLADIRLARLPVGGEAGWATRVRRAADEVQWTLDHARTPLTDLLTALPPDPSGSPIQLMFALQDFPAPVLHIDGASVTHRTEPPPIGETGLFVESTPRPDGRLDLLVTHRAGVVGDATARAVADRFARLVSEGP